MKKYLLIPTIALTLFSMICFSCKSKPKDQSAKTQTETTRLLQVDDLLAQAEKLNGQPIEVEGVCTHICSHGGGKIFLMGSDDTKTIRVEAGKEIGKFQPETVNNIVRVKGKLVEERIDEAYLSRWEEEIKTDQAEKHGNSEAGCESEQKAMGETPADNVQQRIDNFRKRIAERQEKEGKDYLSFYHIDAESYQINK